MANLPGSRFIIQTESVLTRAPTSENLMQGISSSVNFILENFRLTKEFILNGNYSTTATEFSIDGLFVFPVACEIVDAVIAIETPGSSGTTEFDIKYSAAPGGSFTSIFSTTPKASVATTAYSWAGVGDSVAGMTAPVMTTYPYPVAAKSAIRLDVMQTMQGNPEGASLIIYYRPI